MVKFEQLSGFLRLTFLCALQVYIERVEGCDHMVCSRCATEFCYRCGQRRLRSLKLLRMRLEDHDLKYSILGCNDFLFRDKPALRRVTRGAIFGIVLNSP